MRPVVVASIFLAAAAQMPAAVDSALLGLVPAATQTVAGIQVREGKTSALGQFLMTKATQEQPGLQKLIDTTGFDPRQDLEEVLVATYTTAPAADTQRVHHKHIVLARGMFDVNRMKQAFTADGGTLVPVAGLEMLVGKDQKHNAVAFLDGTLAVAGDRDLVETTVRNRSQQTTVDPALLTKINAISSNHQAWFASVAPAAGIPAASLTMKDQPVNGAVLQSILQSSGGLHFGADSVELVVDALTRSPQDAQSLTDVVRFFASMVQMQRQNGGPAGLLAPSLDAMQLTTGGNSVHLSLSVPEQTMEQVINHGPRRQARSTPRP